MAVVNLNNELKELFLKEQEEIDRILADLSNRVAENANGIRQDYTVLAESILFLPKPNLPKVTTVLPLSLMKRGGLTSAKAATHS